MTRVLLLYEDKTGGGLHLVVRSAVRDARRERGLSQLHFLPAHHFHNNVALLRKCEVYELFRFNRSVAADHVACVMDAKESWRLPGVSHNAPLRGDHLKADLDSLRTSVIAEMASRAKGAKSESAWGNISDGFHPHLLVWERESLILPVADGLGLGPAEPNVYDHRGAAGWVGRRFRATHGRKYVKSIHGNLLLARIAASPDLLARVLASNASLQAIVADLAAISS